MIRTTNGTNGTNHYKKVVLENNFAVITVTYDYVLTY